MVARSVLLSLALLALAAPAWPQARVPTDFVDQLVADDLDQPVGMAFLPDGRLLVVEQRTADLRVVTSGQTTGTAGTVPGVNSGAPERGLLGIAVDPEWPVRPFVYVHYTSIASASVRVSRFTLTGDLDDTADGTLTLDVTSRHDLITDAPDVEGNHNGGSVRFGPDGMLYVSLGEDAHPCAAQDRISLRGVVLRLDVSGLPLGSGTATKAALVPADNPFASATNVNERLVWALGLRNPFRIQIDGTTGEVFIGDVGQSAYEEVSRAGSGGLDFGWPYKEGPADQTGSCPGITRPALTPPVFSYDRSQAGGREAAVICAGTYRPDPGAAYPFPSEYVGDLFVSDYYGGMMWRLHGSGDTWSIATPVAGQPTTGHWAEGLSSVSDYAVGPDGALWYCRQTGQVRRIATTAEPADTLPTPPPPPPPPPPQPEVSFGAPYPLPSAGAVHLSFTLPQAARVSLAIRDIRGRRVRNLVPESSHGPGAVTDIVWDGNDDRGRRVPNGVYFADLHVDGDVFERRIVLVR